MATQDPQNPDAVEPADAGSTGPEPTGASAAAGGTPTPPAAPRPAEATPPPAEATPSLATSKPDAALSTPDAAPSTPDAAASTPTTAAGAPTAAAGTLSPAEDAQTPRSAVSPDAAARVTGSTDVPAAPPAADTSATWTNASTDELPEVSYPGPFTASTLPRTPAAPTDAAAPAAAVADEAATEAAMRAAAAAAAIAPPLAAGVPATPATAVGLAADATAATAGAASDSGLATSPAASPVASLADAAMDAPPAGADAAATTRARFDDIDITQELPVITSTRPALPPGATSTYEAFTRQTHGQRRSDKMVWLAGAVCSLGLLVGLLLATGVISFDSGSQQQIAEPAVPAPAVTSDGTSASPEPSKSPSAKPSRKPKKKPKSTPSPTPSAGGGTANPGPTADQRDLTGQLRSAATGLCLRASKGLGGGGGIQQDNCSGGNDRQWVLRQDSGRFQIINVGNARCLGSPNQLDLALATLTRCTGDAEQQWQIEVSGNAFILANTGTGKCLDVPAGTRLPGLRVSQFNCTGATSQVWQLVVAN